MPIIIAYLQAFNKKELINMQNELIINIQILSLYLLLLKK